MYVCVCVYVYESIIRDERIYSLIVEYHFVIMMDVSASLIGFEREINHRKGRLFAK